MSEEFLRTIVFYLVRLTETGAVFIIFTGALIAFIQYVVHCLIQQKQEAFSRVRLNLGRFLALGLEFQLASDLLSTAVAPSFEEIGKLAAVAAIRTGLNYFLSREIQAEKTTVS